MSLSGIVGKYLKVDRGTRTIEENSVPEDVVLDFLGGYGAGVRYIYDNQKPNVDPLSADSILGFVTGTLTGTKAITGNRYTVVEKSPKTGGWGDAICGGNFGPGLKFAGFDAVFFHGASETPVYLLVENGNASLEDADGLWGADSNETEDKLKEKHGKNATIACIGV